MTGSRWFIARAPLALATIIFLMIGAKYVLTPASAAAGSGLAFLSKLGQTNARAGTGGLALGCGLITLWCLVSIRRVRLGLGFVAAVMTPVLLIRIVSVAVDGTFAASARILAAETVLLLLTSVGLALTRPLARAALTSA